MATQPATVTGTVVAQPAAGGLTRTIRRADELAGPDDRTDDARAFAPVDRDAYAEADAGSDRRAVAAPDAEAYTGADVCAVAAADARARTGSD